MSTFPTLEICCVTLYISVDFIPLDLSSLQSVKQFAEDFLARDLKLNILINNGKYELYMLYYLFCKRWKINTV